MVSFVKAENLIIVKEGGQKESPLSQLNELGLYASSAV